ncbi:MAG: TAXI family TRAP transporter solute-binding subunit [Geminicoccaceae bacterium]
MRYKEWLLALAVGVTMGGSLANAEAENQLAVAIGMPGSDSFTFGTELWAMSQIALLPKHDIAVESKEVEADEDRLSLLQNRDVEAALVYGRVPNAYDDDVRAIMALWPEGISSEGAEPVQFLVHKDVAADVVYLVTKAMFEHADSFKNAHAKLGVGQPTEAMAGLDIPLHAGAYRFYEESGFGRDEAVAANDVGAEKPETDAKAVLATTSFRDFDDAELEPGEVEQIAAACRQALEIGALSLVLGDLSNTGCEVYQRKLNEAIAADRPGSAGEKRSQAVAAFATSVKPAADGADASADSLFDTPVGRGGPAIRWESSEAEAGAKDGDAAKQMPVRSVLQPTM